MKKHLMAIDAGTGSIRTVIFDEQLNQVVVSQREWTHPEDPRYPGAIDFDTKNNFDLMIETIKEAIAQSNVPPESIVALSTTSMREGFVLYDQFGNELWAVSNVDSRAIDEVTQLKLAQPDLEAEVFERTGQTFALSAIPRLLWVKKNLPNLYAKVDKITMLNDWLSYKLTNLFCVEPSNGSTTGLIDLKTRDWAPDLIEKCGLKPNIYPKVYESGSYLAHVSNTIAALTGLPKECQVYVGGGDVQLGCLGVGSIHANQAALLGGSFWQLEYNTNTPAVDDQGRIRTNCHGVEDIWQQELIAFYPGLIMRWFRDAFCQDDALLATHAGQSTYERLNTRAKKIPIGSYGMLASFSSVMDYKTWKHPAPSFTNFTLDPEKFGKATFYRSILENAALVTLGHKRIIEAHFGHFPSEIIFASGASNSDLWCQIVADALQVRVKVPVVKEATALGAAIYAAVGSGIIKTLDDAIQHYIHIEKTYEPHEAHGALYDAMYQRFIALSQSQDQLCADQTLDYMWRAPGV